MPSKRLYFGLCIIVIFSLVVFPASGVAQAQAMKESYSSEIGIDGSALRSIDTFAPLALPSSICDVNGVDIGAYIAVDPPTSVAVKGFEKLIGRHICSVSWYQAWNAVKHPPFPAAALNGVIYHDGYNTRTVLHLTWEPWAKLSDIASGKYDVYLTSYATQVKNWGGLLRLRFGHEMIQDGTPCYGQLNCPDWYPWQDQPTDYVAAYRHVHDVFTSTGASNVEFVWCANNYPFDVNVVQQYYPGQAYVDWLCMDGYNPTNKDNQPGWPDWLWFDDIFFNIYHTFVDNAAIFGDKPIAIGELSSCEAGPYELPGQTKPAWITNAFDRIKSPDYASIKAFDWFHINKITECNWRVNSSPASLSAFQTAISDPYFGSHRLLSFNLLSPAVGEHVLVPRPRFDWDDINEPGMTGYTLQIAKDDQFKLIVRAASTTLSEYTPTIDLLKGGIPLFWRVQIRGTHGASYWSPVHSFFSAMNPPLAPVLLLPASNALMTIYKPTFTWKPVIGTVTYIIQIDDNADFGTLDANSGSSAVPNFTPSTDLASNTKFYWRVRAVNASSEMSNWSIVRYFRSAILYPTLLLPGNSATNISRMPFLDWSDVSGNVGYVLQIWKKGTPSVLVKTVTLAPNTSQYQFLVNLLPDTEYSWRVQTKAANGPSLWSEFFDFTTSP
jgi:hypothetical protein